MANGTGWVTYGSIVFKWKWFNIEIFWFVFTISWRRICRVFHSLFDFHSETQTLSVIVKVLLHIVKCIEKGSVYKCVCVYSDRGNDNWLIKYDPAPTTTSTTPADDSIQDAVSRSTILHWPFCICSAWHSLTSTLPLVLVAPNIDIQVLVNFHTVPGSNHALTTRPLVRPRPACQCSYRRTGCLVWLSQKCMLSLFVGWLLNVPATG